MLDRTGPKVKICWIQAPHWSDFFCFVSACVVNPDARCTELLVLVLLPIVRTMFFKVSFFTHFDTTVFARGCFPFCVAWVLSGGVGRLDNFVANYGKIGVVCMKLLTIHISDLRKCFSKVFESMKSICDLTPRAFCCTGDRFWYPASRIFRHWGPIPF